MAPPLPNYSTGTVSVLNGGTTVTLAGGDWSGPNARAADFININELGAVLVTGATDGLHLEIPKWLGADQVDVPYVLYQSYGGRVVGVAAAQDVGVMLAKLRTGGLPFLLEPPDTVPDPSLGADGQYALDPITGAQWVKIDGVWTPTENALGNGGNPVAADYVVTVGDCSRIILAGTGSPSPLNTLTLPPVAGFPDQAVITIINGDAARGKMLSGFPADLYPCLFPKQVLQVRIVDGAWATSINPGPWRPQGAVTLYVDPVLGSDTLADGLARGAGALATIYHAFRVFQSFIINPAGFNPAVQLPPGGGTSATSLLIANSVTRVFTTQADLGYSGARVRASSVANPANFMEGSCTYVGTTLTMTVDTIGGSGTKTDWALSYCFTETPPAQITGAVPSGTGTVDIFGNETTPTAVRWKSGGIVVCNGAVLALRGLHTVTITNGQVFLTIDKQGTVVFQNMSWGGAVAGTQILVKSGGNFVWDGGSYSVGDASLGAACFDMHILNMGGDVNIEHTSPAISVPASLTFSAWYNGQYPGSRGFFGGSTYTGAGSGAGSAGYKFAVQIGASIALAGAVLPGNTAGYSVEGAFIDGVMTPIRSHLVGLGLSTAGSSATFGIAAGIATDSTNARSMSLASAYTKTTGVWALGSGNGAMDTGTVANSTWYHVHLIKRIDTGVVDVLFSLSATAPTLPANYTLFRRIGSMKTNGSAQWVKFIQDGDKFRWAAAVRDVNAANPGTAAVTRALASVPSGIRVQADISVDSLSTNGSPGLGAIYVSDLLQDDVAASASNFTMSVYDDNSTATHTVALAVPISVMTDILQQIRTRCGVSTATDSLLIMVHGWTERRGRDL